MYTSPLYTSIYNIIAYNYIYTHWIKFSDHIYIYIYVYINYIIKWYIYIIHSCSSLYLYNQISPKQTGGFQNKHAFSLSLSLSTRMRAFAKKYEDLGRYKHGDFSRSSGYITTREDPIRPYIYIYKYFRRNKVYASWKLDKASISVNRGTHFQVHFVWQVWDSWLSPAFESTRLKAFGGWKFDRGTPKLHASVLPGKGRRRRNQTCSLLEAQQAQLLSYQCI